MTQDRNANVSSGETHGPEQEPREVGAADPAVRDPRPDGPMNQTTDPEESSDALGASSDARGGQREEQDAG